MDIKKELTFILIKTVQNNALYILIENMDTYKTKLIHIVLRLMKFFVKKFIFRLFQIYRV